MRRLVFLLFFLLLASCVPVPEIVPEKTPAAAKEQEIADTAPKLKELVAKAFVIQSFDDGSVIRYSYTSDRILVSIDNDSKVTEFFYDEAGKLAKINAVELVYDSSRLKEVVSGHEKDIFEFNAAGQLVQAKGKENLFFMYSDGVLSEFKRGSVGAVTYFTYEKDNIAEIKKANNIYELYYNEENYLEDINYNKDTAHLIIGVGKDDRITKLSGKLYGPGETIDYIAGKINVLGEQNSVFAGNDEALRIDALNKFLICTRFKSMPVEFDPVAYAVLKNHFGFGLQDYFISNYYCEAFK